MDRRRGFGLLFWIVGILVLVGVGVVAYNLGVSQGLEASGQVVADGDRGPYIGGYGGYGIGFGFFGLLFPLLFLLLLFGLFRAAFRGGWGGHDRYYGRPGPWMGSGPGGPGGPGGWQGGPPPPMFEEWHRRAHGEGSGDAPPSGERSTTGPEPRR